MYASSQQLSNVEIIVQLRQSRVLQESGDTALHICAVAGGLNDAARFECLEMLMSLGASLDLPNKARLAMTGL